MRSARGSNKNDKQSFTRSVGLLSKMPPLCLSCDIYLREGVVGARMCSLLYASSAVFSAPSNSGAQREALSKVPPWSRFNIDVARRFWSCLLLLLNTQDTQRGLSPYTAASRTTVLLLYQSKLCLLVAACRFLEKLSFNHFRGSLCALVITASHQANRYRQLIHITAIAPRKYAAYLGFCAIILK